MAETKQKPAPSLRTPRPKKPLGLAVPPALRLPHEDLISPQDEKSAEPNSTLTSLPSQTSQTRHTSSSHSTQATSRDAAPARDFARVANSITREAVPSGLFTGKSKQLYDCLYSLTRGAVVPSRTVRISRPKLMKRAGIGARATFDTNVDRLVAVGLVSVRRIAGEHDGNEYTVLLPEEAGMTSTTSQTSQTRHAWKLDGLVSLDSSQTRHTLSVEKSGGSAEAKTFSKTNIRNDDDEPLARALREAERELTGKNAPPEAWAELAEILVAELKMAAGRTTVSSAPAFLAEHLRRRLWKREKRQLDEMPPAKAEGSKIDASQCRDCFGTGMYYPEGYEKGVARCSHSGLAAEEDTAG
jgi:hypothetical protein